MSFIIVASCGVDDKFYSGGNAYVLGGELYSTNKLDAKKFDLRENAEYARERLERKWNEDSLSPPLFPIRFWIDDTNNPAFDKVISSLENL